jgi:hypothetical protein
MSGQVFDNACFDINKVKHVHQDVLDKLERGPVFNFDDYDVPLVEGDVYKSCRDTLLWFFHNNKGEAIYIPTYDQSGLAARRSSRDLKVISPGQVARIPRGPDFANTFEEIPPSDGALVTAHDASVPLYIIEGGQKRAIPDWKYVVVARLEQPLLINRPIRKVAVAELHKLRDGPVFTFPIAHCYRKYRNGTVCEHDCDGRVEVAFCDVGMNTRCGCWRKELYQH